MLAGAEIKFVLELCFRWALNETRTYSACSSQYLWRKQAVINLFSPQGGDWSHSPELMA